MAGKICTHETLGANYDEEDPLFRIRERLPAEWRGLLDALRLENSLQEAERWLQTQPQFPRGRSWDAFVSCLTDTEPTTRNGCLGFEPVLLALPRAVQASVLGLLYKHHHKISTNCLRRLLKETEPSVMPGTWLTVLHTLIAACVREDRAPDSSMDCGKPLLHVDFGYKFSQTNAAAVSNLCQSLSKNANSPPWQYSIKSLSKELVHAELSGKPSERETNGSDLAIKETSPERAAEESIECIVIDDDSERDNTDVAPPHSEVDVQAMEVVAEVDQPLISTPEEPFPQQAQTMLRSPQTKDDLCPVMAAATRLKEHWLSGPSGEAPPSEIQVFLTLSPQQVEKLLRSLELSTFPDLAWAQVCEDVLALSPAISYSVLVIFFSHTVVPLFIDLNQAAPRILLTSLNTMAAKFPKQLIDSICSGLKGRELNAPQVDLLTQLNKDRFSADNALYLLQQLVSCGTSFSEHTASLLQSLLPQQGELDAGTLTAILACLSDAAPAMANSMQYGKLLLHLISRLGKQLSAGHVSVLQHCLDLHKTFMKRSVSAALKRLFQ